MFGYSFLIGCLFWAIALVHCELVDDRAAWDNVQCYNTADSIRTCQSCVSIYDESFVYKKGCYEELTDSELAECVSTTSFRSCLQCQANLCNKGHPEHKCVECDTSNDSKCAHEAESLSAAQCGNIPATLTSFYCYVKLGDSGALQRGCLTTLTDVNSCERSGYEKCDICETNITAPCNTFNFPRPTPEIPTEPPTTIDPGTGTANPTTEPNQPNQPPSEASSNWIIITLVAVTLVLVIGILGYLIYSRKK